MSTRCRIGMMNEDGTVSSIYCHHDGYPSGVGTTLVNFWKDSFDVIELIANGPISTLGENLDTTDFYNDSGRTLLSADLEEYFLEYKDSWAEYLYLYKNGNWYLVTSMPDLSGIELVKLKPVIEDDEI